MPDYIGAIDQGTTSTRFIVFDRAGRIVAAAQKEHEQIYPQPGWVEHDPEEIWRRTQEVIAEALAQRGLQPADLAAIGITNQRETTVLWNRKTGRPVYNALVWQDTRVARRRRRVRAPGGADRFRAKTGLPLATYFSGLKTPLDAGPRPRRARSRPKRATSLFGNIDTFLIWQPHRRTAHHRLHQRQPHAVDESGNAGLGSRIARRAFGIPRADSAADRLEQRSLRRGHARRDCRAFRWPAFWAISRRRWWARPASSPAKPRTPTAPAVSC